MTKKKKSTHVNYVDIVLVHNPQLAWYEKDGIINIDINNTDIINKIMYEMLSVSKQSHITLSELETIVWNNIDGERTIGDIIHMIKETYPQQSSDISNRVMIFANTLLVNNFVRVR